MASWLDKQNIASYLFLDHICDASTELFYKWLEEEAEKYYGMRLLYNSIVNALKKIINVAIKANSMHGMLCTKVIPLISCRENIHYMAKMCMWMW